MTGPRKLLGESPWPLVLVVFVLSVFVAVGANIAYTNRVAAGDRRAWCSLVSTLDDAYKGQPPTTNLGRTIAAEMHALRVRLGCP